MVLRPSLKRASSTRSTLEDQLEKYGPDDPVIPSTHMTFVQFTSLLKTSKGGKTSATTRPLKSCFPQQSAPTLQRRRSKTVKKVSFCTHAKHDTIWTMVHKTRKVVDEKKKKRVWWNTGDLFDPQHLDAELFFPSGTQFLTMLEQTFEETDPQKDDCYKILKEYSKSVDMKELQRMSCVRDMEPLVNPLVYKRMKKHRRVVLAAQDVLKEEGYRIGSKKSMEFIASRSLKFSRTTELFSSSSRSNSTTTSAPRAKNDIPRVLSLRRALSDKDLAPKRAHSARSLSTFQW